MADQHRYSEDMQRGGRRDWNDRSDSRAWGENGGRRPDAFEDQGRYEERSARDWPQARGAHWGNQRYENPGRQFSSRDDRDVAPYSGGWSDRGGQGDWQSSGVGQRGGSEWGGGTVTESRRGFGGYRGSERESFGGFAGGDYGDRSLWSDSYGGEHSRYARGGQDDGGLRRSQFGGYGQPVSQGDGYGQRAGQSAERGRGYAGSGYAGRGPKDYQRSDDRIREEISDRLTDDDRVDPSDVTVQVQKGEVTLSGTVNSRDQKRCAEDCAEAISGVREVINNLRVARDNGAGQSGQSASPGGSQSGAHATQGGSGAGSTAGRSGSKTAGQSGGVS